MRPAVVFLPDTALLVPGAAGRDDPGAALREEAVGLLRAAAGARAPGAPPGAPPGGGAGATRAGRQEVRGAGPAPVLVVAPGRAGRALRHPVATGLGAAGLPPRPDDRPADAPCADVPASVALTLLHAAGVTGPVDVTELARDAAESADLDLVVAPEVELLVVVGSPSARHGVDAPLAGDPRAADVDAALLAGLADGPEALVAALTAVGATTARELAVSGWPTWRAAAAAVTGPVAVSGPRAEVVAGAWHVVAAWHPAPGATP